jgi:hypothetical protein
MSQTATDIRKTVPLYKVVMAAIADSFEDIGRVQQLYSHWAVRKLKELERQTLKTLKRTALLTVNRSTNTATVPLDCNVRDIFFVGAIVNGKKVPLKADSDLVDSKNIEDIPCEDKCEKCQQDKAICNDLTVTEDTVLVTINDVVYEQTVIKKLYPDGSYYLETRIPIWDVEDEVVTYTTTKEFIAALDLKPCGCIDDTPANIDTIQCVCPDVWCQYYAPCDNSCDINCGSYRTFEETGLIQFDNKSTFTKVYIEYYGFLVKVNGQYRVPEVAFEALVEWVKFRNVDGKKSTTNVVWQRRWEMFRNARSNMEKELGRFSLTMIIQASMSIPKFDLDTGCDYWCSGSCPEAASTVVAASISQAVTCTLDPACPVPATKGLVPFQLAKIVGTGDGPVAGVNTYQNDALKNAVGLAIIIVNNANETILANQFTFNSVTGTISRWQGDGVTANDWFAGDVLIANFSKFI